MNKTTLYTLRKERGLTQTALAEATGLRFTTIQKYERGDCSIGNMTLRNAVALADALGIQDLREFLRDAGKT